MLAWGIRSVVTSQVGAMAGAMVAVRGMAKRPTTGKSKEEEAAAAATTTTTTATTTTEEETQSPATSFEDLLDDSEWFHASDEDLLPTQWQRDYAFHNLYQSLISSLIANWETWALWTQVESVPHAVVAEEQQKEREERYKTVRNAPRRDNRDAAFPMGRVKGTLQDLFANAVLPPCKGFDVARAVMWELAEKQTQEAEEAEEAPT